MDAYIVIGNPNTRKASIVRSLTGCFNRSVRDILPAGGKTPLRVYARVGSLQETRTRPDDFRVEVEKTRCMAVLCCITSSAHPSDPAEYPDAQTYIARFEQFGWHIRAIAVLGQNSGGVRSAHLRQFAQATTAPINVTSHSVRVHFGWE